MATETFKVKIGCASHIIKEIFQIDNRNYNFHHDFLINRCNSDQYITALKQLLLLAQKYGTLYLIAAKMQPHEKVLSKS